MQIVRPGSVGATSSLPRQLRVTPFEFADPNAETARYWRVTNGVTSIWLAVDPVAETAVANACGVYDQVANRLCMEPYFNDDQHKGPYFTLDHFNAGGDGKPDYNSPKTILGNHCRGNWFGFTDKIRLFKSAADATAAKEDVGFGMLALNNSLPPDVEEMVIGRRRILMPWKGVVDEFPAVKLTRNGEELLWDNSSGDYGSGATPAEWIDLERVSGAFSQGFCVIPFDWPYRALQDEIVTVSIYVKRTGSSETTLILSGEFYPYLSLIGNTGITDGAHGIYQGCKTYSDTGEWKSFTIPARWLVTGTNYLVLYTRWGSTGDFLSIGKASVTSNLKAKNYHMRNYGSYIWPTQGEAATKTLPRYWEFIRLQRDVDEVDIWCEVVSQGRNAGDTAAGKVVFDFICGNGSTTWRRLPYWHGMLNSSGPDPAPSGLERLLDQALKFKCVPDTVENDILGTITMATPGYEPGPPVVGIKLINEGTPAGTFRFSRRGRYPVSIKVPVGTDKNAFAMSTRSEAEYYATGPGRVTGIPYMNAYGFKSTIASTTKDGAIIVADAITDMPTQGELIVLHDGEMIDLAYVGKDNGTKALGTTSITPHAAFPNETIILWNAGYTRGWSDYGAGTGEITAGNKTVVATIDYAALIQYLRTLVY